MPPVSTTPVARPHASLGLTSARTAAWITWSPMVLAVLFIAFLSVSRLRELNEWLLAENHPVEMLTFVSLLVAGVAALRATRNARMTGGDFLAIGFFALFGIGLVLTALDEISYGQTFFDFDPPAFFAEHNQQGELTLHNLPGMNGHNSFLRLAAGLGGMIGIWAARWPRFARFAPPRVMTSWFATIAVLAGFDVFLLFHPMGERTYLLNEQLTEVVEMMIGFASLIYVWLCFRRAHEPDAVTARPRA